MEVQAPRCLIEQREQKTVYGRQAVGPLPKGKICSFWLAGRCNRNPCRFLHAQLPLSQTTEPKQSQHLPQGYQTFPKSRTWQREADSSGSNSFTSTQPSGKTDRSYKKKSIFKSSTQSPSKTDEYHKKNNIGESSTQAPNKTDGSHKRKSICKSPTHPNKNGESQKKLCIYESPTQPSSKIDESQKDVSIICGSPTQPSSKIDESQKDVSIICGSPTQPSNKIDESQKVVSIICGSPTQPSSKIDESQKDVSIICGSPTQSLNKTEESHNQKSICNSSNTVCKDWIDESCVHGDKCEFLHKWSYGKGFSFVTKLKGHNNAITGIALPSNLNKLVTVGKDKTMRIWDCNNGQCLSVENFEDEVRCMTTEGPFIFVGMQNTIKGWDTQNHLSINLSSSSDKVNAVVVEGDKIFAGTENGSILVWKTNVSGYPEIAEPLRGHKDAVVCLRIGAGGSRMFSGSRDNSIKVWDLNTMECMQTLNGHTSTVSSLLCWDVYLLSGSLDRTTKVWACNESGNIEEVYTHEEGHGVITLNGIHIYDPEKKPILLVSCDDKCVRLYELPSFEEKGRLFAKKEVCAIETVEVVDSQIIFFTGDASGEIAVWKVDAKPSI